MSVSLKAKVKIIVFLALIVLLIMLFAYLNTIKYKISDIVMNPSAHRFSDDISDSIAGNKKFVENFINSYRQRIDSEISPHFKNEFLFNKHKGVTSRAIFSTVEESLIYIYPGKDNKLLVDVTKYPIQMTLFSGIDSPGGSILAVPYSEALSMYKKAPVMFKFSKNDSIAIFTNLTLNLPFPKVFEFSKKCVAMLHGANIEVNRDGGKPFTARFEDVGILTGDKDFSLLLDKANELGRDFADLEIRQLITKSSFFKESLAEKQLNPMAESILTKISRSEKDPSFKYELWEMKSDIIELQKEAQSIGVDVQFVEELFNSNSVKPHDGVLLFYYPSFLWFSLQWSLINLLLLVCVFFIKFSIKTCTCKFLIIANDLVNAAVIIAINGWVFDSRPPYLSFQYWIIPGLLFLGLLATLRAHDKLAIPYKP